MRHSRTLVVCAAAVVIGALSPVPWRLVTVRALPQASTGSNQVQAAPAGQRFGAKPGERGATFYAFEGQAVRVTSRFADATVVADRMFDGDLQARVADRSGNEVARFKVDRIDGATSVLQYTPADGSLFQAYGEPGAAATLDWANRQAYSLWKDGVSSAAAGLEWQAGLMRPKGAAKRDVGRDVIELHTEWANGLAAKASRRTVQPYQPLKGRSVSGEVLVTRLTQDGTDIGTLNWFTEARLLMWDLPGLTKGYLAPEHLKEFGGWPFAPDMTWLNIQALAFQHYKTLIQKQGFVARNQPGLPARIAQFFAPTLHANEEGCDGLHWLDGTLLRYCCDIHDLCYEKFGCNARSWWQFWSSWRCEYCNAWVVVCFLDGGIDWSDRGMIK
jgi:hypothetical protein